MKAAALSAANSPARPSPGSGAASTSVSSRRMLALLAAVFLLPVVVGNGLFWSGWRPATFANRGELLQPPRALPDAGLLDANGQPLATVGLRGKWLLVRAVQAPCDTACAASVEADLQQMALFAVALNKDASRVRRVLVERGAPTGDEATPSALSGLQQRFPDATMTRLPPAAERANWSGVFVGGERAFYLVDPLGNVMMRYADPTDLRGALKDLERLLKYSWIR